jgi:hypothetical protein
VAPGSVHGGGLDVPAYRRGVCARPADSNPSYWGPPSLVRIFPYHCLLKANRQELSFGVTRVPVLYEPRVKDTIVGYGEPNHAGYKHVCHPPSADRWACPGGVRCYHMFPPGRPQFSARRWPRIIAQLALPGGDELVIDYLQQRRPLLLRRLEAETSRWRCAANKERSAMELFRGTLVTAQRARAVGQYIVCLHVMLDDQERKELAMEVYRVLDSLPSHRMDAIMAIFVRYYSSLGRCGG